MRDTGQMSVGDSGALVIDSLTEKAYGYVIGINYFQELYVIPLQSVLDQIYQMLPISNGTPEIFMALDSRPGPLPKDYKHASFGFASHLNQYWPRTGMYNIKYGTKNCSLVVELALTKFSAAHFLNHDGLRQSPLAPRGKKT